VVSLGCSEEPRRDVRQVIWILLDAARADRFSAYGYPRETTPNIDRLAQRGVVFENCYVQRTHTRATLPTMLFSRYFAAEILSPSRNLPLRHPDDLFRKLDDEAISLPRALSENGIHTAAISAHLWLQKTTPFAREFDELHDLSAALRVDDASAYPRAEAVVDHALDWIDEHENEDFLLYLHLMDTHFPHYFDSDAREFYGPGDPPASRFSDQGRPIDRGEALTGDDRRYLDALYDGSLRYADRQVGRILRDVETRERLDETLIVVTADHGEFLLEKPGHFEHGHLWLDPVAKVPMIFAYSSRLRSARVRSLCEGVDLMPTVLGMLDISIPAGKQMDGIDQTRVLQGEIPAKQVAFGAGGVDVLQPGVRVDDLKGLFWGATHDELLAGDEPIDAAAVHGILYDLDSDPEERSNLWARRPELATRLLRAYRAAATRSYRRYQGARTRATPTEEFAIASPHLSTGPGVQRLEGGLGLHGTSPGDIVSESGWVESDGGAFYGLLARSDAKPLNVSVRVPNGNYRVRATLSGDCAIAVPAGSELRKVRGAVLSQDPTQVEVAEVGPLSVRSERAELTLSPEPSGSGCLVRSFIFDPRSEDLRSDSETKAERERLRALGYLED
jgi:arylsulfatase